MKVFLCVIILVMPNGESNVSSSLVGTCPEQSTLRGFFNDKIERGLIQNWYGICIETPLSYGEAI